MNTRTSRLIEETFDNPFDLNRYQTFATELLTQIDAKPFRNSGNIIPDGFREHVALFGRIGTTTDPNGDLIDVLYVKLKKRSQMVRARALQRNFIARHLKKREKEAALVAFYVDGVGDWRLSLVWRSEEMAFDEEKERLTFDEQLTPARRSSYLLGATEPSHTAKRQLLPLLAGGLHPTLDQLQEAFGVEIVTREFFDQYKTLFLALHDAIERLLKQDGTLRANFKEHQIDTHNFAKKLLGQIVFLYFLQKKGWLGVPRGADWQSGSPRFLRNLFEGKHVTYDNFFNDVLEPLFYEALAEQRHDDWYAPLNCRIPFLNGGLFEPMNGYDWRGTTLALPNALFSNQKATRAGDTGDGILDVFDRYNFTVHEEEPLEKEVAVDPEMLGKVFENLLEVTDRKSKGAFYTPREIVHYMCQESLINYLDTALNVGGHEVVPRDDVAFLIRHSGAIKADRDRMKDEGRLGGEAYQLPEAVRTHAARLDRALANVKVCDPAIGSGAFPVGMLNEMVRARAVLQMANGVRQPNLYDLKRHAIQHSLYGVDLDAAAVDIAKLRLWLSLVVDEEDFRTIKPLPNLGYKIAHGNSVTGSVTYGDLFDYGKRKQVRELKAAYFETTDRRGKAALREQIDQMLAEIGAEGGFDFGAYFSEVLVGEEDGFDIVIGNPPYVRHELIKPSKPALKKQFPDVYAGTADLYVYFYARGIGLLKPGGTLAYITSNKFMRAGYGKKLRTFLTSQTTLHSVIDFGDLPVFDATAYPTILIVRQLMPTEQSELDALMVDSLDILQALPQQIDKLAWEMPQKALRPTGWALAEPEVLALMEKLRKAGQPLEQYVDGKFYSGIKTGLNEAFVITRQQRDRIFDVSPASVKFIKPWLRGRDIKKWKVSGNDLFVIYVPWNFPIKKFPAVENHLARFKENLSKRPEVKEGRHQWFAMSRYAADYIDEFSVPKIVYPDIAKKPEFAFDDTGALAGNTIYIIPNQKKYLLSILNSPVILFFYQNISSTIRGGYFRFIATYMSQIPIPSPTPAMFQKLEEYVQKILDANGRSDQVAAWERELNALVYDLYGLTPDEIALIESHLGKT